MNITIIYTYICIGAKGRKAQPPLSGIGLLARVRGVDPRLSGPFVRAVSAFGTLEHSFPSFLGRI